MHFRVTGEWNGEPFNRVIEAENINDCHDHWMIWAQIAHAEVTNIRIEEPKELPPDGGFFGVVDGCNSHCINNMQCNSVSFLHYLCFLNPSLPTIFSSN